MFFFFFLLVMFLVEELFVWNYLLHRYANSFYEVMIDHHNYRRIILRSSIYEPSCIHL